MLWSSWHGSCLSQPMVPITVPETWTVHVSKDIKDTMSRRGVWLVNFWQSRVEQWKPACWACHPWIDIQQELSTLLDLQQSCIHLALQRCCGVLLQLLVNVLFTQHLLHLDWPTAVCIRVHFLTVCSMHLDYTSCSYTSSQDGFDPQQLALVVLSCYQIASRPHCAWSVHYMQIALAVLFLYKTRHLLMCTLALSSHVDLLMGRPAQASRLIMQVQFANAIRDTHITWLLKVL